MNPCTPTAPLISDMEDGNYYFGMDCPKGAWFLSTAGGGTITAGIASGMEGTVAPVAVTDNGASTKAIHVAGSGQANTVSGTTTTAYAHVSLSASLNSPSATQTGALVAAAYTGIKFSMKLTAGPAGATTGVHLQVSDQDTNPAGGRCTGTGSMQCYDHAYMALTPGATWTQVMVPFSGLTMQEGFGNPTVTGGSFPKAAIYSIEWKVMIPATGAVAAWDIWVDDLSFY